MKSLKPTEFGNPILRGKARQLNVDEIMSEKIQQLIANMQYTLQHKKYGVGLAAPQVGEGLALAIVEIQPLPHRPKVEPFAAVIINPEITETVGRRRASWEGCISAGKESLFARVPRYKKIKVKFYDKAGKQQAKTFDGLPAHVIQHEIDHLNGMLFVDRVRDTSSYMTLREYKKRVVEKRRKHETKKSKT